MTMYYNTGIRYQQMTVVSIQIYYTNDPLLQIAMYVETAVHDPGLS